MEDAYKTIFKSGRLYARQFTAADLEEYVKLDSNKDVMRYIGGPRDQETIEKNLKGIIEYYEQHPGFGVWAVCKRRTNEFIGWVCLKNLDQTTEKELGYRLFKSAWGKGYATEISKEALEYGFWDHELSRIVAITVPENVRSLSVIKKLGFRYKREDNFYGKEVQFFALKYGEWERGRGKM